MAHESLLPLVSVPGPKRSVTRRRLSEHVRPPRDRVARLLAVGLVLVGLTAMPQPGSPAEEPAAETSSPIPAAEIATRSAEVADLLQSLDALSAPSPEMEAIERELPERSKRLQRGWDATLRRLAAGPSAPQLEDMHTVWRGVRAELSGWADLLTARGSRLQQEVHRLADLREAWAKSLQEIQGAKAPSPVLQEIQGMLGAISAAQTRVNARLASLLILQYQVALEIRRCDQVLSRIAQAKTDLGLNVLARSAPAVWSAALWSGARSQLVPAVPAALTRWRSGLANALDNQARSMLLQLLLFGGVLAVLLRARSGTRGWVASDTGIASAGRMLERPVSAALVLTLLATPWLYPGYSLAIFRTAKLLGILPALRLLTPFVPLAQAGRLSLFGVVMAVDAVRPFLSTARELDQVVFLAEMAAASLTLGLVVARMRRAEERAAVRPVLILTILWLAFALALATGALGYLQLAQLLGDAALQSTYTAIAILIGIWVLLVLLAYALWTRPLGWLASVRQGRTVVLRKAGQTLRWLGALAWALVSLRPLTVFGDPTVALRAVLHAGISWGSFRLTLGDALLFGVTVWAAFLLAAVVRVVLEADVFPRVRLAQGVPFALASLTRYAIVFTGFVLALGALGVDLTKVTILLGAFGVGVGFGLQTLVGNFAAGLILLFERPIREGDAVQVGDVQGVVRHIGVRASLVRTGKGAHVFVPNAQLLTEKITNWTYTDRSLRIDLPVTVAQDGDPRRVIDLLCRVAAGHPEVQRDPAPAAFCTGIGAGGLTFELRTWTGHFDRADAIRSELAEAVYAALAEAKIAFR